MINQTEAGVPVDILLDLSTALCPRGPVAEPKSVAEILERCDDAARRAELWELMHRIDKCLMPFPPKIVLVLHDSEARISHDVANM